MPKKKNLRVSTRGTNILLSENKADVKRRRAEKAGLNPIIIPKTYAHTCRHWMLEKLKEDGNIYRCLNPMCKEKFGAKKIKKGRG